MALVSLHFFPSNNHLSTYLQQLLLTPLSCNRNPQRQSHYSFNKLSFCHSPHSFDFKHLSLSHTPTFRTKENTNFTLNFASTSQEEVLDSSSPSATAEVFSRTRLIAHNVPWTSTPDDIRALFERHGKVLEVELSMYNKTRNRGLAFVEMGSPEEAVAALNNLGSYEFEGRILNIAYARPKKKKALPPVQTKPAVTYNLFVANLPYEARSKDVREFFDSGTGRVVSANVIFYDNPKKSAGYGFVSFESEQAAEAALSDFQGKIFMGRPIRVTRGRQFVKQAAEETASSEETSSQVSVNGAEADQAD